MRHQTRLRSALVLLAVVLAAYLLVSYLFLPEFWIFREAPRAGSLSSMVTTTTDDIPGDPINVGLVGTKEEVIRAFDAAGWDPADPITLRSSIDIGLSVVLDRPDLEAPVSTLLLRGTSRILPSRSLWEGAPTSATMSASGRRNGPEPTAGRSGWARRVSTAAWG